MKTTRKCPKCDKEVDSRGYQAHVNSHTGKAVRIMPKRQPVADWREGYKEGWKDRGAA